MIASVDVSINKSCIQVSVFVDLAALSIKGKFGFQHSSEGFLKRLLRSGS